MLRGQRAPLAANFTAGYGVWLARANFNRQSLRSLLGREGGIDRPHVYLMQPYDPNRRIIVMLHGLASSPEAWVELANEILGDEALRQHYQIWQVYYPTNMPVALNHAMIRRALGDTLTHFDPSGQAPASSDLVLVGHSMGGVIARLMVSSTDQSLVQAADHSRLTPQQIRRIDPMLRFEPFPNVSSAIFIAAPHRGTSVAGGRLGRWMAGFIRFPLRCSKNSPIHWHPMRPPAAVKAWQPFPIA
jgi:pimeloyl-ACP methyl ester carboxylesterase